MPYALLGLVAVVLLIMAGKALVQANPTQLAPILQRSVAGGFMLLAVFLALRGALPVAVPLFLFGLGLLGTSNPLGRFGFPWGHRSPNQKSAVRTSMLAMELDHDTGAMDGEILSGPFTGQRLSDLDLESLLQLLEACQAVPDQSAALLEAYLDHAHPAWRGGEEEAAEEASPGSGQRRTAPPPHSGGMTVEEARSVLGVGPDATPDEIRAAHRRLMKLSHPDHGGSDYLASKVNQAKEMLLGKAATGRGRR